MRKVFFENLPKRGSLVDWKNSCGQSVKFEYDGIMGEIKIMSYSVEKRTLDVFFNNNIYTFQTSDFKYAHISNMIDKSEEIHIDFVNRFYSKFPDTNITIHDKYVNAKKKIKCTCQCGNDEWYVSPVKLMDGQLCRKCRGDRISLSLVKSHAADNSIYDNEPDMVKYFANIEDTRNLSVYSNKVVSMICPICGSHKNMAPNTLNKYGFRCGMCSDGFSYPNKFMFSVLKQLNVDFETEYSPVWANGRRYDFYIPSKNLIIEMDGGFHYMDNDMTGQTADEIKDIDLWKDSQAKLNNIEIVRVDSTKSDCDYIRQNILNSKISNVFNLNPIKWDDCGEYAMSSRMIKVCEAFNSNKDITSKELAKQFKVDPTTIVDYLNTGNSCGLCKYDGKYESKKNQSKKVIVSVDGVDIRTFNSIRELERLSNEIFGKKFVQSSISKACNGISNPYKGYGFRYI